MLFMALDMDFVYSIGCLRFIHSDWSKFQGRAVYLVFMLYKRTQYNFLELRRKTQWWGGGSQQEDYQSNGTKSGFVRVNRLAAASSEPFPVAW